MSEQRIVYEARVLMMGDIPFLFIRDEDGGRLIRAQDIISLVPNFKLGGSMIFLHGADKAITVDQPPEEIVESLENAITEAR